MTNNIPQINIYTLILEIFPVIISSPTEINFLGGLYAYLDINDNNIIFLLSSTSVENKSFIQFQSISKPDELTFKIKYQGSVSDHSKFNFLFYSKVVFGRVGFFNHLIFDIDEDQHQNQISY